MGPLANANALSFFFCLNRNGGKEKDEVKREERRKKKRKRAWECFFGVCFCGVKIESVTIGNKKKNECVWG